MLRRKYSARLASTDEQIGNPDDPEEWPSGKVLYRLIMESPLPAFQGIHRAKALYAFELLCRHYGRWLDNDYWSGMCSEWFETVDKVLLALGFPFCTKELIIGGAPLGLPDADDFPAVNWISASSCRAALEQIGAVPMERIADEPVKAAFANLKGWFETCAESNLDLVCFYY